MKDKTYFLVSLGCAKNTVDSTSMALLMEESGYHAVEKPGQAQFLIVNTCGFIQSAREESLDELRGLASRKKRGQYLIAAGCLTERYRQQVIEQVPGLDGILGTRRWMDVLEVAENLRQHSGGQPQPLYNLPESPRVVMEYGGVLRSAVQGASAYLKIADGCRRLCAFCAIPLIKGSTVSRTPQHILDEARTLQAEGVKELILIAQDTTDYGHDLGLTDGLAQLLDDLAAAVPHIPWIRIMYAFPGYISDRLIESMTRHPQILPYLDIPLQHAHPDTLRRMHRPADVDWVRRTVAKMRAALPGLAIRTTFIVGYPGETEEEFQALLDFVTEMKFDKVGAFTFSFEPGTASEPLGDPIPEAVKQERLERLMSLQEGISLARNQEFIGKTLEILVEGANEGLVVGRSYRDAPEIDGLVFAEGQAEPGAIVPVQITGALTHDLSGRLLPR